MREAQQEKQANENIKKIKKEIVLFFFGFLVSLTRWVWKEWKADPIRMGLEGEPRREWQGWSR